jgi:hypothetical protein
MDPNLELGLGILGFAPPSEESQNRPKGAAMIGFVA